MSESLTLRGLTLSVEDTAETDREGRPRFAWSVTRPHGKVRAWRGDDLFGARCGPEPPERAMLGAFCGVLAAALEAKRYRERTGRTGENEALFPPSLLRALEGVDPDELSLAADELASAPAS